jgi:hypothetical protein
MLKAIEEPMNRNAFTGKWMLAAAVVLMLLLGSCKAQPTTTVVNYTQPQLEYRLLAKYPDVFWCDPDYYPVARAGQEQQNAITQFPSIQSNQQEFSAILEQLKMTAKTDYSDSEKLLVYREYKKLTYAAQMTAGDNGYRFDIRTGTGQGQHITGSINNSGTVTETKRETSVNTCPICLTAGTLIDTPDGQVPVEQLVKGMSVWSLDDSGKRVAVVIVKTAATPVPLSFRAVRIELNDGRSVTASPGHPTAEGRAIVDYQAGDMLDGAQVIKVDFINYESAMTFDFLPDSTSGLYWANNVLLKSTLKP